MMVVKMILGSHVKFNKEQLYGSVKEAISYGANTFMFYTGAPQNTIRSILNEELTHQAWNLMKENNIDINNVICHAPYIINLANKVNLDSWDFSINFLRNEIDRCEAMGIKYIVVHPGNHLTNSLEVALKNITEALNLVINREDNCMILIETMAGKGTECGKTIDELKVILDGIIYQDKIGVCVDTCHINDAGYKIEDYLEEFKNKIGLDKIKCLHINDSKNVCGAHKDRHENIGFGTIGFTNLVNLINNEELKNVPKILETPYIENYPPYKFEIAMIKNNTFDITLKEKVVDYYK